MTAALLFHHVGPPRERTHLSLTVAPDRFRRFLVALRRSGLTGVSAREWHSSRKAPAARGQVVLTFDDAYADLSTFALPVLMELGFSATVFVVGNAIGGTNAWDAFRGGDGHRIMSEDDLREWASSGCEVGGHGMTHTDLTTLDRDALMAEIEGSQRRLTTVIDGPVTSFAYPYGSHNETVRQAVMQRYDRAFGVDEGRNGRDADLSRLHRTMVQPADTTVDVLLRGRLGRSPLQTVRSQLRIRSRARALAGRLTPR